MGPCPSRAAFTSNIRLISIRFPRFCSYCPVRYRIVLQRLFAMFESAVLVQECRVQRKSILLVTGNRGRREVRSVLLLAQVPHQL